MKSLQQHILEKLVVNKKYDSYRYHPKTPEELRGIIEDRYKELGPGTKNEPIDFNDIDVSKITSFYDTEKRLGIFEKTKFEYIDVSDWDVSNVSNMKYMFDNCEQLESIGDLSNWNVSNVTDMTGMFYECISLKSVGDLSNWNISNVEDMISMFNGCESLESVGDLSNWDVSNDKDMWRMFRGCKKEIVPNWYKINHKKI